MGWFIGMYLIFGAVFGTLLGVTFPTTKSRYDLRTATDAQYAEYVKNMRIIRERAAQEALVLVGLYVLVFFLGVFTLWTT